MAAEQYKDYWKGYTDGHKGAAHAKNQPWYLYRNFRGPVQTVVPEPKRQPQVYNRWTNDARTKAALRWAGKWLFATRKQRLFMVILAAFTVEKFDTWLLHSITRYNNLECTMEYAYKKEREWKEHLEAERARRRALGLPEDGEEEEVEESEE
mmetsp:Transcript_14074/g.14133  ORF Transcript_14074/g.14133 Transcript_14074/m.14133 type:complete len:152 (+) Transcript_14074:18-473(+)